MPTMCPEIVFGKVVSFAGVGNSIQPEILGSSWKRVGES
jgi:hypothetical protein